VLLRLFDPDIGAACTRNPTGDRPQKAPNTTNPDGYGPAPIQFYRVSLGSTLVRRNAASAATQAEVMIPMTNKGTSEPPIAMLSRARQWFEPRPISKPSPATWLTATGQAACAMD
jgi:hypothetical protein